MLLLRGTLRSNVQITACGVNCYLIQSFSSLHSCFYGPRGNSPDRQTAAGDQSRCNKGQGPTAPAQTDNLPTHKKFSTSKTNSRPLEPLQQQHQQQHEQASNAAAALKYAPPGQPLPLYQFHQLPLPVHAHDAYNPAQHGYWHHPQQVQPHWARQQQWRTKSTSSRPDTNVDRPSMTAEQQQHHHQRPVRRGRLPVTLGDVQQQFRQQSDSSSTPSWQQVEAFVLPPPTEPQQPVNPTPWTHLEQHFLQQQRLQQEQERQQQQQQQLQPQPQKQQVQQEAGTLSYPVHAVHLAGEIDFMGFATQYRNNFKGVWPPQRDHVLIQLESVSDNVDLLKYGTVKDSTEAAQAFMIIYRYGSVIFSNVRRDARDEYLQLLKPFVAAPKGQPPLRHQDLPGLRSDETTIVVRPNFEHWSALEPDKIVVQMLDAGNLRVISTVLSQSVALDYFNSRVDEAIQQFTPYLTAVAQTGQCDTVKEAGLLQLIADNSLLYTDVVTKIGLLDISQTAWKQDKHFELWSSLRADYEIERRFDAINRKLGPMIENAKFLLDVRAEQKSSGAEWIIIGLIMLEVLMNGAGHLATFWWH